MRIDMQHPAATCKSHGRFVGTIRHAVIAIPDDGAFAITCINDDKCDLIARSFNDLCVVDIDAFLLYGLETKPTLGIGAEAS
jgi:hypothetical protein